MIKVIGVRFKKAGKIYYFSPSGFSIKKGDYVIVETARGIEFGECVIGIKEIKVNEVLKDAISLIDGKGGGSPFMAQGAGKNNANLDGALDYAFNKIKEMIG